MESSAQNTPLRWVSSPQAGAWVRATLAVPAQGHLAKQCPRSEPLPSPDLNVLASLFEHPHTRFHPCREALPRGGEPWATRGPPGVTAAALASLPGPGWTQPVSGCSQRSRPRADTTGAFGRCCRSKDGRISLLGRIGVDVKGPSPLDLGDPHSASSVCLFSL